MKLKQSQQGVTLFVALVFLLVMTLFAVSSVNMSTINLRIVNNMQASKQMEGVAQDAIEQMLSDSSVYGATPGTPNITVTTTTANNTDSATVTDFGTKYASGTGTWTVWVDTPKCINYTTASGYSAAQEAIIPEDTTWEFAAHVKDTLTGASVAVHQGFEMRMLAGNCPDPSS